MTLTLESLRTTLAGRFDGKTSSPTDIVCHRLYYAAWSSDAVRTRYCLPLAMLSEATATPGWLDTYILQTIRVSVAGAFRAAASIHPIQEHRDALNAHAETLSRVVDKSAAGSAARSAMSTAESAAMSTKSVMSAAESARSAAQGAAWIAHAVVINARAETPWQVTQSAALSAESAAWSAQGAAKDKGLIEAVGTLIAAQGNPEAQAAWDLIMAEDTQRAHSDAAKGE